MKFDKNLNRILFLNQTYQAGDCGIVDNIAAFKPGGPDWNPEEPNQSLLKIRGNNRKSMRKKMNAF